MRLKQEEIWGRLYFQSDEFANCSPVDLALKLLSWYKMTFSKESSLVQLRSAGEEGGLTTTRASILLW